ncbi:MAG: hypothetical protein AB1626_00765 [Candidatus Micrarchaeota archaeon]
MEIQEARVKRLLEKQLSELGLPLADWRVSRTLAGTTHKGEPVLLVELKHGVNEGRGIEKSIGGTSLKQVVQEAYAYAALHPTGESVYGFLPILRKKYASQPYADMESPSGWLFVEPSGRGVGSLLVAHALEKASEWRERVNVSGEVVNAGFLLRLFKLGVEKARRRPEAFVAAETLAKRPWREYLLKT